MSPLEIDVLAVLLDVLIPGDTDFPRPGAIGIAPRFAAHARFAPMAAAVLVLLPPDFVSGSAGERFAGVAAAEARDPATFEMLLVALYSLYYTDLAVLDAIERVNGYRAGPPQPGGYALPPFDPAMVAVPAARGRQYRQITEQSR